MVKIRVNIVKGLFCRFWRFCCCFVNSSNSRFHFSFWFFLTHFLFMQFCKCLFFFFFSSKSPLQSKPTFAIVNEKQLSGTSVHLKSQKIIVLKSRCDLIMNAWCLGLSDSRLWDHYLLFRVPSFLHLMWMVPKSAQSGSRPSSSQILTQLGIPTPLSISLPDGKSVSVLLSTQLLFCSSWCCSREHAGL